MNESQPSISPLDLTPRPPAGATAAECVEMWIDLMNVCDELLLARFGARSVRRAM